MPAKTNCPAKCPRYLIVFVVLAFEEALKTLVYGYMGYSETFENLFRDCTSLTRLTIVGDIEIGERAFENCASLSEISLPDNLAEI